MPQEIPLPEKDLAKLKRQIIKHVKALNKSGQLKVDESKVPTEVVLQVLGIKTGAGVPESAEEWLCGCDYQCGTHT
jgi:hypothetical protein